MAALITAAEPFLCDKDDVSVTIGWAAIPNAKFYHIQMKTLPQVEEVVDDDDWTNIPAQSWTDLSKTFASNQVRKKNLIKENSYCFRYR